MPPLSELIKKRSKKKAPLTKKEYAAINQARCLLIDKLVCRKGQMTELQMAAYYALQMVVREYIDCVAPLPDTSALQEWIEGKRKEMGELE